MIELKGISYKYPRGAEILRDFTAAFELGELVVVSGRNGSGKTTLARLLTGILRPDSGSITIDGLDSSKLDLFEIGQHIGCVFQDPSRQLFCDTVENEIAYGLKNMGLGEVEIRERVKTQLEFFRLLHHKDTYPGKLSQGEKQRLMLAVVLSMGTRYILLDEPTTSLDVAGRRALGELLERLRAGGCGIIVISHDRAFIERFATRELVVK